MTILTIRTDKPEAEIGLYDDQKQLAYEKWQAHRQLAETIHQKILNILTVQGLSLYKVEGVVVFKGPGSFTGLRIGVSVANSLAYSLKIPVIGSLSNDWIALVVSRILAGELGEIATIEYGAPATTTKQRK